MPFRVEVSRESNAKFTKPRAATIGNRPAVRYDYEVEQRNSQWGLTVNLTGFSVAHGGSIWIDRATSRVLRIEMAARNLPGRSPLGKVTSTVEYAFVKIGDGEYLLASHSETLICQRDSFKCGRNVTDFRDYGKYSADANIKFEDAPKE